MAPVLKPAYTYAVMFGVKALVYGPPGKGKTPLLDTAPRPVLMAIEPGLLSMRNSQTMTAMCDTPEKIDDFFNWLFTSAEARAYDTVGIDSVSEMSYRYLMPELKKHKDGRKAYGEMSQKVFPHLSALYYLREKHVFLTGKQTIDDELKIKVPQFEGKDLSTKVPHLYDEIFNLDTAFVPGVGDTVALRTQAPRGGFLCRDRSGKLDEFEIPHLGNVFNKIIK